MLTVGDIASRYAVTRRTVRNWLSRGEFPPPDLRLNKRVIRWRQSSIEKFERQRGAAAS